MINYTACKELILEWMLNLLFVFVLKMFLYSVMIFNHIIYLLYYF